MLEIQRLFCHEKKRFKNMMISFYTSFGIRNRVNVWQISRRIREKRNSILSLSLLFSSFPSLQIYRYVMSPYGRPRPTTVGRMGRGKKVFLTCFLFPENKRKEREQNTSSFPFPFILLYTHLVLCGLSAFNSRKILCVHLF